MAAAPSIPPSAPVAPAAPALQLILHEVPVRHLPASLTVPGHPTPIEGRVVSSNLQTQQIVIRTTAGEVTVQSSVSLPPGTKVSIEIYTAKAQLLANIAVEKRIAAQTQELQEIIQPPTTKNPLPLPPLQEKSTVTALLLPSTPPPPLPIEQLAQALEAFKTASLQKMPLAILPPVIQNLPEGTDIKMFLEQLSPKQMQEITRFVLANNLIQKPQLPPVQPDIIKQLLSAYLPQSWDSKAGMPTPVDGETPDVLDNNLLHIMRAQAHAKVTHQAIQSPPPLTPTAGRMPPSAPSVLHTLLASIENLLPARITPFPALFQQLAPQASAAPFLQNMYRLDILKILPPGTPPKQIEAALQKAGGAALPQYTGAPQLAEVETVTSEGQPLLKTADSRFVLRMPAAVPVGSTVIFKATPMTPEQVVAGLKSLPPGKESFDPLLSTTWPALQEALQTMTASTAPAAQPFRNTLPTATRNLAPTALFFLAALRLGSIDKWLGDDVLQVLRQSGKKDLADRLGSDFSKLSNMSKEPLNDGWRSISMPLLHDEQLNQMQFYVRQQYDRDNREKGENVKPATRFILNLHLSRMGDMQLDGFIQKKTFDIVIRTQEKLPLEMRQELMKRFAQGLEQVQMQGGVSFQAKLGWVVIELPCQPGVVA